MALSFDGMGDVHGQAAIQRQGPGRARAISLTGGAGAPMFSLCHGIGHEKPCPANATSNSSATAATRPSVSHANSNCRARTRSYADAEYGRVRARLEAAGTPIGANDLLIAAQALALGFTVVTGNEHEFARVEGLRVENWLRGT